MKILQRTNDSVLWLLNNNDKATNNLIKAAENNNIDPKRLIFAQKLPYDEHLKDLNIWIFFLIRFHTTLIQQLAKL